MVDIKHFDILKRGVENWNSWRRAEPSIVPDLEMNSFRGLSLQDANFSRAQLSGTDFSNADVRGANFDGANLMGALLHRANFQGCNFGNAQFIGTLMGADFREANFFSATFVDANINFSEFAGSSMHLTTFADVDLRTAKGLEDVCHRGPSTVGLDTIYRSAGQIPEAFLRGCGVPDSFITQMKGLLNAEEGIRFYSCFISYSSRDEDFARRLHCKLRDAQLRVWFAPEDMSGGKKLHEQIDAAIHVYDKLLLVLSEESLKSAWVMDELRKTFRAQRSAGKRKLFPVRLTSFESLKSWVCRDSVSGEDLAEEVRQYFIPDFSDWKSHDSFERSFERLLKDLRS